MWIYMISYGILGGINRRRSAVHLMRLRRSNCRLAGPSVRRNLRLVVSQGALVKLLVWRNDLRGAKFRQGAAPACLSHFVLKVGVNQNIQSASTCMMTS